LCTFIARSASSRASLSRSVLIVSLTIKRFGRESAGATTLDGDLGRTIGGIRRAGRIVTGASTGAGGDGVTGVGTETTSSTCICGGADRLGARFLGRFGIITAGIPDRLGKGERYARINCDRRSLNCFASQIQK